MSGAPIDGACSQCGEEQLHASVEIAAHDPGLLDVILKCDAERGGCGHVLNSFLPISEMMEVPQ